MTRIALRGLAARRLRTLLSALSIVLGVALVAGALTLGGALERAAGQLTGDAYDATDAVVTAPAAFDDDHRLGAGATVPAAMLDRVRDVPGVGLAVGDILGEARIVDRKGEPSGDGPFFGVGLDGRTRGAAELTPFRLQRGRWPSGPGEVVVDAGTAKREGLHVGGRVRVAAGGPARGYTITGLARFGRVDSLGTATVAIFDLRTAQSLFGRAGAYDGILVRAAPGTEPAQLRAALARELGAAAKVSTARAADRFTLDDLTEFVGVISTVLLVFGGVAVLVGAVTIGNALSLTVVQRTRELALLRAAGAGRGQVLRSVLVEAGVLGAAGSALGLAAGYGLAHGLQALVTSFGLDLPRTGLRLEAGTVVAGVAVGMGATLAAGLSPALRATRVAPVAALRAATGESRPPRRRTLAAGGAIAALGAAMVAAAMLAGDLSAGDRMTALIPGCLAIFLGAGLLSPRLAGPLAGALGRPSARLGGVAGVLARRNAVRNPGRTAATAAALMIGVALVTFASVLASGLKTSGERQVTDALAADLVVAGEDGWSAVSAGVERAAASVDGAQVVTSVVSSAARAFGDDTRVAAVDPRRIGAVWNHDWVAGGDGAVRRLAAGGALVRETFADEHGLALGDRFTLTAPDGRRVSVAVSGIVEAQTLDVLSVGDVTVARQTYDRAFTATEPRLVLVSAADGRERDVAAGLRRAVGAFPEAAVFTAAAFAEEQVGWLDNVLGLFTVLLALAILISILGIVNTLALSVAERTRELGLLRAVGMSPRQARRMVRHEGALTALVGAVLGIAVGLALAGLMTAALADEGLRFTVPAGSLAAYAVVAALAGVAAATLPARRAGRVPVLAALAHE